MKHWWLLGLTLSLLTACNQQDSTTDLSLYLTQLKRQVSTDASLLSDFHFRAGMRFNSQAVRSPFPQASDSLNAQLLAKPPLQRYSLDVLRLLGIVQETKQTFAVIQTPDQKIYQVSQNDLLGNHYGRITAISAYEVTIIEPADLSDGILSPRTITLHLKAS